MKNRIAVIYYYLSIILSSQLGFIKGSRTPFVTCGSIVKLINTSYGTRLHSHDVKYGSGSGQQSVTATERQEDIGSHWIIKGPSGKLCDRGQVIKCGDTIRFEHLTTNKNLHSHLFDSPLSAEQEISAYGKSGDGDTGDHWELVCGDTDWVRDNPVRFRHLDTGAYLGLSGRSFGRPISGQMEVVGFTNAQPGTLWKTAEGMFIHSKDTKDLHYPHTEL